MIAHVVLFRPRPDVPATDRETLALSFERALRETPSVRRAAIGRRISNGAGYEQLAHENYPYAAVIEFDDLDGLKSYLHHPSHEDPARRFYTAIEAAIVFDYEMVEGSELRASVRD